MLLIHTPGWTEILSQHRDWSPANFSLHYAGNKSWPVREIAEQLHCYPRAEHKLCDLHMQGMIYLRESLEQASGYATATYRARRWPASTVADITGGLGVDTAAWARSGATVCYFEKNTGLAEIATHNHQILGLDKRIHHTSDDGLARLSSMMKKNERKPICDLIYADPSRRSRGTRVVTPDESDPPVLMYLDLIRSAGKRYLVKLSPMMDVNLVERDFTGCRQIIAVSVEGEVKELLVDADGYHEDRCGQNGPVREAVLLDGRGDERFRVTDQRARPVADIKLPGNWLYEPDPALLKMRLVDQIAMQFGLSRLSRNAGYLTGSHLLTGFPGKVFKVEEALPFKPRKVKSWLKNQGYGRVHIHQRGFPLTVNQLYSKLNLKMGEDAHLFAVSGHRDQLLLLVTRPEKR